MKDHKPSEISVSKPKNKPETTVLSLYYYTKFYAIFQTSDKLFRSFLRLKNTQKKTLEFSVFSLYFS